MTIHSDSRRGATWLLLLFQLFLAASLPAQQPSVESRKIGTIDFYGVRQSNVAALRERLGMREGQMITRAEFDTWRVKTEVDLAASANIAAAAINAVCCGPQGEMAIFVGVRESTNSPLQFRPSPSGDARLPEELLQTSTRIDQAIREAVMRGKGAEDQSQGHSLLTDDPAGRALQESLVDHARRNEAVLRRVLREASDPRHRAIAAQVLGYFPDKSMVVDDLVAAVLDPDQGVRNNVMRTLGAFAGAKNPVRVPADPFIALLNSLEWTDLNKASAALAALTASREPVLLDQLRATALASLVEIARWKSRGHAVPGYLVLGHMAGLRDEELLKRWFENNDIESVIQAALGRP